MVPLYFRDPDSGIREMDICLGKSRRDCTLFDWYRYPYGDKIVHTYEIDAGVPAWLKVRAINNGKLEFMLSKSYKKTMNHTSISYLSYSVSRDHY